MRNVTEHPTWIHTIQPAPYHWVEWGACHLGGLFTESGTGSYRVLAIFQGMRPVKEKLRKMKRLPEVDCERGQHECACKQDVNYWYVLNRFQLQHHLQGPWPWLNPASSGHDPAKPPHVEQQQQQRGPMLLKICDTIECHYPLWIYNIQATWPPRS